MIEGILTLLICEVRRGRLIKFPVHRVSTEEIAESRNIEVRWANFFAAVVLPRISFFLLHVFTRNRSFFFSIVRRISCHVRPFEVPHERRKTTLTRILYHTWEHWVWKQKETKSDGLLWSLSMYFTGWIRLRREKKFRNCVIRRLRFSKARRLRRISCVL